MIIIIDSREQKPLSFTGHETTTRKLDEGDYNHILLVDKICIERKSLADFYQSITSDHLRFKKEIQRCVTKNKKIYIFLEGTLMQFYDGQQVAKAEGRYRYDWSPIIIKTRPITLMRIVETMKKKYELEIVECESRDLMSKLIIGCIAYNYRQQTGKQINGDENMVDVTQAMEGQNLNADIVRKSPSKKCVVIDAGEYVDTEYGAKLCIGVQIDGKSKLWKPNKDTVNNIAEAYGTDSNKWVGNIIYLSIGKVQGKDTVNGIPMPMPKVTTESL